MTAVEAAVSLRERLNRESITPARGRWLRLVARALSFVVIAGFLLAYTRFGVPGGDDFPVLETAALLAFGLAALTVWACMAAYTTPGNLLRGSLWMPGFAIAGGILFGGFALLSLNLAVRTHRLPPSLQRLVESTALGRIHFAESHVFITTPPEKEPR